MLEKVEGLPIAVGNDIHSFIDLLEQEPFDQNSLKRYGLKNEDIMELLKKVFVFFIEDINPCGGEQYSKKTLIEAEAASPEAYVKENGRFPILESTRNESGDVVIVTGDNQGSFVRYTFTE